jgi:parallel beta-helix repeat protein
MPIPFSLRIDLVLTRVLSLLVLGTSTLQAGILYVAPTGNDANTGTQTAPFREIRKALTVATPGTDINVANGDYKGFNVHSVHGLSNAWIRVIAPGKKARILPTTDRSDNRDTIFISGSSRFVIDGLQSFNGNRAAVRISSSQHIKVRNCVFGTNGTWGIFTDFSDDVTLEKNKCFGSIKEHGIYCSNSGDRPIVRGNTLYDNAGCGLHMNGDVSMGGDGIISGAIVERNTIYNNGRMGGSSINCDGVQNSKFVNNLVYNAHAGGITLFKQDGGAPSTNNRLINNLIHMASDGRWPLQIHNGSSGTRMFNNMFLTQHLWRGSVHFDGLASMSGVYSDYNIFTTNSKMITPDDDASYYTLAQWQARGQDAHSMTATPKSLFINWAAGDYRHSASSVAVNTGIHSFRGLAAPKVDVKYLPRPADGLFDIGAHEKQ